MNVQLDSLQPEAQSCEQMIEQMEQTFASQQRYFAKNSNPTITQRKQDLALLRSLLSQYKQPLVDAIAKDYGHRSTFDTLISDIMGTFHLIDYCTRNLSKWMKPSKRRAGLALAPSTAKVYYLPIGVVGVVVPWNFPIGLALTPLVTAIAAGNTAMLKMSEFTPHTNKVIKRMLAEGFEEQQVAVIEGEVEVATRFSQLAFNHIVFTGSTAVGKHIMRAAADNLTPVTLELGGKSPTIIAPDFDIEKAVERIVFSKSINSGQACVAPDYVLLPKDKVGAFVLAYQNYFNRVFPKGLQSDDYSSIVNQRQFERLKSVLADAKEKGAKVHPVVTDAVDDKRHRMLPHLVTDVSDDMLVVQEEIFGPILPLVTYDSIEQAHAYVTRRDRPLALYLMSNHRPTQDLFVLNTLSGGVCINDMLLQVAVDDAPFGGIGPSGMGHYHGPEGFRTLSHAKTVLNRGRFNYTKLLHPPYNTRLKKAIFKVIG